MRVSDQQLHLGELVFVMASPTVERDGFALSIHDLRVGSTVRLTLNAARQVIRIELLALPGL